MLKKKSSPRGWGLGVEGGKNQLVSFFPHPSQFILKPVKILCHNDKTLQLININLFYDLFTTKRKDGIIHFIY